MIIRGVVDSEHVGQARDWAASLLDRAYGRIAVLCDAKHAEFPSRRCQAQQALKGPDQSCSRSRTRQSSVDQEGRAHLPLCRLPAGCYMFGQPNTSTSTQKADLQPQSRSRSVMPTRSLIALTHRPSMRSSPSRVTALYMKLSMLSASAMMRPRPFGSVPWACCQPVSLLARSSAPVADNAQALEMPWRSRLMGQSSA